MGDSVDTREPLLEVFIFETNEFLEKLETILLEAEKKDSLTKKEIDEIFRIMHTTKSSSAVIGLNLLSKLSHRVEDVFYYIREESLTQSFKQIGVYDVLLKILDYMNTAMDRFQKGEKEQEIDNLLDELSELLERIKQVKEVENHQNELNKSYKSYKLLVTFEEGAGMENIRAFNVMHALDDYVKDIWTVPAHIIEDLAATEYIVKHGFQMFFLSEADKNLLEHIVQEILYIKSYEILEIHASAYYLQKEGNIAAAQGAKKEAPVAHETLQQVGSQKSTGIKQNLINISTYKLDRLLDFVGEISIAQSMVIKNPDLEGLDLPRFNKAARELKKLIDELQDIVMTMRMVPISHIFYKTERLVRDMCKQLNKQVELTILGEETEVDKTIIEHLGDPLMHLIRNAVDHGIESVEERKEKNKPEIGHITLEAQNTGGDIIITLSDDGRGLNKEKILDKAYKMGIIQKDENLSLKEIFSLILQPGFSTKEDVTQFSGRGVGLDIVKRHIEEIGGNIEIESEVDKGTAIRLRIPLTLAIVGGMQIQVGDAIYTVPITNIKESFRPKKQDIIITPEGKEYIQIREGIYPVLRLHDYYHVDTQITELTKGIILVVESEKRRLCIFVDQLIGQQQVVIKGLPSYLEQSSVKEKGIVGCIILGEGCISLVIDVMTLLNTFVNL